MHINQDTCVVEIVDREGNRLPDGRTGSIALTNLYNYTMPFLRYTLGDRGQILPVESRCACGTRGPVMTLLEGREDDILQLPDGSLLVSDDRGGSIFRISITNSGPVRPGMNKSVINTSGLHFLYSSNAFSPLGAALTLYLFLSPQ